MTPGRNREAQRTPIHHPEIQGLPNINLEAYETPNPNPDVRKKPDPHPGLLETFGSNLKNPFNRMVSDTASYLLFIGILILVLVNPNDVEGEFMLG